MSTHVAICVLTHRSTYKITSGRRSTIAVGSGSHLVLNPPSDLYSVECTLASPLPDTMEARAWPLTPDSNGGIDVLALPDGSHKLRVSSLGDRGGTGGTGEAVHAGIPVGEYAFEKAGAFVDPAILSVDATV